MNIEKTSPEFEAWFKERFWHECYEDVKHHLFAAWQASRESLVIELPEKDPAGTGPGDCGDGRPSEEQYIAAHCNVVLAQCRQAIEAAGVKVKS